MGTSVEQEGKWPLWFGREATRTWRKSTTSKDFFDNFGREFSLPTNWFGKLETSWIHFCKKIAATYKLLKSPTFRPIFQIGPRTKSHSICTDRRRPGPAAALQVSPTSDTCQSVAILMNRPQCRFPRSCVVTAIIFPHTKWLTTPPPPTDYWPGNFSKLIDLL